MNGFEKRRYPRRPIKLDLFCRRLRASTPKLHTGTAVNVATGGLYFQTKATHIKQGDRVEVTIAVPPDVGRFQSARTMRTIATVVRTETLPTSHTGLRASPVHGVALQFCRPPKLDQ